MIKTEQILNFSSIDRERSGGSKCEDFVIKFNPTLTLDDSLKHEIAIDNISMTYSWHNITDEYNNNKIKYSPNGGQTWSTVSYPPGMYSYQDLDDFLHEIMKLNNHGNDKFDLNFRFILTSFKVRIILTNNYQIDFRDTNFGALIGFEKKK